MSKSEFDEILQYKIEKLKKNIAPERDLWFGIEQAISKKSNFKTSAFAAAFLLFFLGTGFLLYSPFETLPHNQHMLTLVEQHQQQKNILFSTYKDHQPLAENWDKQMEELDIAAKSLKQAIKNNPENATLLIMLKHVHSKQIALINRVHKPYLKQPFSI